MAKPEDDKGAREQRNEHYKLVTGRYEVAASQHWVVDTRNKPPREMACCDSYDAAIACAKKSNEIWNTTCYAVAAPVYWVVDTGDKPRRGMICFNSYDEAAECARKSNELWRGAA
jgi:hypothetical protein